jgi:hypothetical protein
MQERRKLFSNKKSTRCGVHSTRTGINNNNNNRTTVTIYYANRAAVLLHYRSTRSSGVQRPALFETKWKLAKNKFGLVVHGTTSAVPLRCTYTFSGRSPHPRVMATFTLARYLARLFPGTGRVNKEPEGQGAPSETRNHPSGKL